VRYLNFSKVIVGEKRQSLEDGLKDPEFQRRIKPEEQAFHNEYVVEWRYVNKARPPCLRESV